jgi:FlaG/FlaF family flagellin (archaellin)
MKTLLIVLMVILAGAIGVEVSNYDIDLGRLRDTGNIQESRVQTKNGVRIFGNCVSDNLNCANFKTQWEAQAKYEQCAEQIRVDNKKSDTNEIKNLDIYGLDKDKDGTVCESLPKSAN